MPKRFEILRKLLSDNKDVECVVSYDWRATGLITNYFDSKMVDSWVIKNQRYCVYELKIDRKRKIKLISTPFLVMEELAMMVYINQF